MGLIQEKYELLKAELASMGSAAVAFSGGVDSTFLLYAAREALSDRMAALTASSCFVSAREVREAEEYCKALGIRHIVVKADVLSVPGVPENPADRCYLCKRELFRNFLAIAQKEGYAYLAEGSNLDDEGDYRPGMQAVKELGVKSPLRTAGFTKPEIREMSKRLGIPVWNKPSYACLASRIPYGDRLDENKLAMVERAEQILLDLGFLQMRVRVHGTLARIELEPEDMPRFMEEENRLFVDRAFREAGFSYTALDLRGYRTGSLNELLKEKEIEVPGH